MKTKTIPFDLETAKKIQAGEIEGAIKTVEDRYVRIVAWDMLSTYNQPLVALVSDENETFEFATYYTNNGCYNIDESDSCYDLVLEVPEEALKQTGESTLGKCKEGDEVWIYSNYEYGSEYVKVKVGKFSLDVSSGHRRNVTFEDGFTCQELTSTTCWKELPEEAPEKQHPIEESELYQAGYKVGFEAGRCVAFDEKKNRAIKEETPRHKFKPFDKVLVREDDNSNRWFPAIYSHYDDVVSHITIDGKMYAEEDCIPYEGNEHLLGTTDKPKED